MNFNNASGNRTAEVAAPAPANMVLAVLTSQLALVDSKGMSDGDIDCFGEGLLANFERREPASRQVEPAVCFLQETLVLQTDEQRLK